MKKSTKRALKKTIISILTIIILIALATSVYLTFYNNSEPIVIKFDKDCEWESLIQNDIKLTIENEEFIIIGTDGTSTDFKELESNSCVLEIAKGNNIKTMVSELKKDLNSARDEQIKQLKLDRTVIQRDVIDREDLQELLEQENPERDWPGGIISPYQIYITPDADAVQDLANELNGIEEIYAESLDWVWMSDEMLLGEVEKWLSPQDFLTTTAGLSTNPLGLTASDCEEQANTLVSVLIADGYDPENIRVVLGTVNFDGTVGGHAWVQVYEGGRWFDVEATAGNYYDESGYIEVDSSSIPYYYFKYHEYPSVEIWMYYNNEYFWNELTDKGNSPPHWTEESGSWLEEDLETFQLSRRPPRTSADLIYPLRR